MARTCPYRGCDYANLSDDDRSCPACGKPIYFMGGHDFTELIFDRTRDFTGRGWVFAKLDAWLADPAGNRIFFLGGEPGSGKSAVAARLVQIARDKAPASACPHLVQTGLAYYHFCQVQYDAVVEPVGFVKSFSLALSDRYPAFAAALTGIGEHHSEIHVEQTVGQATASQITAVKIGTLEVGGLSARKAFPHVVAEPLQTLVQSSDPGTILILVDALDEALPFDPDDNIVTLLAGITDDPRDLPRQVRFLVTGRPDPRVVDLIGKPALDLVDDAPDSQRDVQDYAERRLTPVLADTAERQELASRIAEKGAGNFLYARYVLDDFVRHPADPAELTLPEGLDDVYATFLKREVGRQGRTWRTYRPLLGALVTARGSGLTRRQLAGIMEEQPSDVEELLEPCMQYLSGAFPDGPFRIYHQSFREFLMESQAYRLEPDKVRADLAGYFWAHYVACRDGRADLDDYTLANLPVHLAEAGRTEDLRSLLLDYGWLQTKLDRLGVNTLPADFPLSLPAEDDPTRKLGRALEQGAYVLAQDPTQLAPQLLGRLPDKDHYEIDYLRGNVRQLAPRPCLLPQTASLRQSQDLVRVLVGHTSGVKGIAVTHDGRIVSASVDGVVKTWELATGRDVHSFQAHEKSVNAICLTRDDRLLVSASDDKTCKVWGFSTTGLASRQILHILKGHTEVVNAVAVTSDGRFVVSASANKAVKVWDLSTGEERATLVGHTGPVNAVAVTFDDRWIVSASGDGSVKIWNLTDCRLLRSLTKLAYAVNALAVTPDGHVAATVSSPNTLQVWDLAGGRVMHTLTGHLFEVHAVALTPDGVLVLSGAGGISGGDNTIKVWDVKTGELRHTFQDHTEPINAIALSPDGQFVVSASSDRTLRLWEMASINRPADAPTTSDWVNGLTATADGQSVISASRNTLREWGAASSGELRTLARRSEDVYVRSVASTPDGQLVISGSSDGAVQVWEVRSGTERQAWRGHPARVYAVTVTPEGRRVISASQDTTLKLWNLAGGAELATWAGHDGEVYAVAVTPDGQLAVSGSADKTLKVWDSATNALVRTLEGHESAVYAVAVTADGHAISGSWDRTLKVWELASGRNVGTLEGHTDRVFGVAVTPDGRRVISASYDETLKVWDLESSRCLATFHADGQLRACVVLPRSALIATGGKSGRVHILRLEV